MSDDVSKAAVSGWVSVDRDGAVRGWVIDRRSRETRQRVIVSIEGDDVAEIVADRVSQKLIDQNEGDGRYAFLMSVPAAYRDGRPRRFSARLANGAFTLKSKADTFALPRDGVLPAISIEAIDVKTIRGSMQGDPTRIAALDVWLDGSRIAELPVRITSLKAGRTFTALIEPDAVGAIETGRATLALPGMVEGGFGGAAIPQPRMSLSVAPGVGEDVVVQAGGVPDGEIADVALLDDRRETIFRKAHAALVDGLTVLRPPPEALEAARYVRLTPGGLAWSGLEAPFVIGGFQNLENPSFEQWGPDGPEGWSFPSLAPARGFAALPAEMRDVLRLTGDCVRFELAEPLAEEQVVLRQRAAVDARFRDGVHLGLAMRSSAPVRAVVRASSGRRVVGALEAARRGSMEWSIGSAAVDVGEAESVTVEVALPAGTSGVVEIAGVRLGGVDFSWSSRSGKRAAETALSGDNHVSNADLESWPHGLRIAAAVGPTEIAEGWFGHNRKLMPFDAFAMTDLVPGAVALAVAAPAVADFFSLDLRLDVADWENLFRSTLEIHLGAPSALRARVASGLETVPEFQFVNRVMLIERTTSGTDARPEITDVTLATLARNLLVTREMRKVEIPVRLPPEARDAWSYRLRSVGEGERREHFVAFVLSREFAVAFCKPELVAGRGEGERADGYLTLEDASIAAQLQLTRGVGHWTSTDCVEPSAAARGGPAAGEPLRWRWRGGDKPVEVLVCVHGAVDETIDCLRSLETTTTVPHTVRIVDDSASPTALNRLCDYARDKPWITVVANEENRGYTFSADRGLRESVAEWVVLLNSDTIVTSYWLEGLLECARSRPDLALVGPLSNAATYQSVPELIDGDGKWKTNRLPESRSPEDVARFIRETSRREFPVVPLLNGFCTLIRREAFLEVGGLNSEAFPQGYGEETDLCLRLAAAGYKFAVADQVYVYHLKSASFGGERRKELTRGGGVAVRTLHPDIDIGQLTKDFRDNATLVRLRGEVGRWYDSPA